MGKHFCASVHLGTGVGKVSRAEHREELLHLVLIKTPMGCEIMLKNVPFHLSILHRLDVPLSHTSVVWCAGLEWIWTAGSELVLHGFSSWAGVGWGVGICFKMLCVKMPALYWVVFGGLPPCRVASVSSVVSSWLPVKPCSCLISKSCFPRIVYLFPRILNAGLINRHLYSTFPLTISKCWVEFNYTSRLLVEEDI